MASNLKEKIDVRQRRILFLIHSLGGGGAERVTANLANHWAQTGWTVTIVTMAMQSGDVYELNPRVRRIALDLARDSNSLMEGLWTNMRRLAAVRRTLRQEKPDVALGIMSTASCLLALTGQVKGCVRIGTERSYPPMLPLEYIWEKVRRKAYGNLDAVVALTSEGATWIKANTNAKAVSVIYNPVPVPLPTVNPVLPPEAVLDRTRKALLAVGSLTLPKAFDRLIHAFAKLAPEFPEWDLAIVGEGPLRPALTALSQKLGLDRRLHLVGRAGNIADWYLAADLFVLTSHFEGFPNVLAEAMAHGLSAVSVDCDTGPRDIISDGIDGLLVAQDNHDALVMALRKMMGDDALRDEMGICAAKIRDRLSVEKVAARWEELFISAFGNL